MSYRELYSELCDVYTSTGYLCSYGEEKVCSDVYYAFLHHEVAEKKALAQTLDVIDSEEAEQEDRFYWSHHHQETLEIERKMNEEADEQLAYMFYNNGEMIGQDKPIQLNYLPYVKRIEELLK